MKEQTAAIRLSFISLDFFIWQHEASSQMAHEDSFPGYRYSNLKGTTRMQCFQIDTYVYSCFRIGTSRVLPGCSSPCGFAALLDILTLPELDHEAVMLKKNPCFLLCWTMTLLPGISGSLCRITVYEREKHISYSTLTYFFSNTLSTVALYSSSLAFILSFLFTQKALRLLNWEEDF